MTAAQFNRPSRVYASFTDVPAGGEDTLRGPRGGQHPLRELHRPRLQLAREPRPDGAQGTSFSHSTSCIQCARRQKRLRDCCPQVRTASIKDAPAREGRFPVVLFSHGLAATRIQNTALLEELARCAQVFRCHRPLRGFSPVKFPHPRSDESTSAGAFAHPSRAAPATASSAPRATTRSTARWSASQTATSRPSTRRRQRSWRTGSLGTSGASRRAEQ